MKKNKVTKQWKFTVWHPCPTCHGKGSVAAKGLHDDPCLQCFTLGKLTEEISLADLTKLVQIRSESEKEHAT